MENSTPATKADIQKLEDSLDAWRTEMLADFAAHVRESEERIGIVIENAVKDVSAAAFDRVDQLEDKVASHDRRIVLLETKVSMA